MSTPGKTVLLFIKAPSHNLKGIESFLGKRNFEVHSESDIRAAICKVVELRPSFIFLAWDHTNPKVMNLPKLIAQASFATLVPYILSNSKEDMRKLLVCPLNPKLYPPLSGPAIERLILKSAKITADTQSQQFIRKSHIEEDISVVRNQLLSDIEVDEVEKISDDVVQENALRQQKQEMLVRHQSIHRRNDILKRSEKMNLSEKTVVELKKTFRDKIKKPLESILNDLTYNEDDPSVPKKQSVTIIQKGPDALNSIVQEGFGNSNKLGTIIQQNGSKSGTLERMYNPQSDSSEVTDTFNVKNGEKTKAYCMAIYSDDWCGYLIIATEADLDFSSIDMVFSDWIKLQFNNLQEIDEYDLFELKAVDSDLVDQLTKKADYFESIKINNYDLIISFFSVDPDKMKLELNEDKNLIKIATEDIPSDVELNFSLHLHLPENKKYLIYTQANKKLSEEQKNRLLSNKIVLLYTPLDFEKEYKKFIAEKNVKDLCESVSKKLSVI